MQNLAPLADAVLPAALPPAIADAAIRSYEGARDLAATLRGHGESVVLAQNGWHFCVVAVSSPSTILRRYGVAAGAANSTWRAHGFRSVLAPQTLAR